MANQTPPPRPAATGVRDNGRRASGSDSVTGGLGAVRTYAPLGHVHSNEEHRHGGQQPRPRSHPGRLDRRHHFLHRFPGRGRPHGDGIGRRLLGRHRADPPRRRRGRDHARHGPRPEPEAPQDGRRRPPHHPRAGRGGELIRRTPLPLPEGWPASTTDAGHPSRRTGNRAPGAFCARATASSARMLP
ncbi:hypothetical protein SGPA1_31306 [Streptomyces misionensis JCM 4497]